MSEPITLTVSERKAPARGRPVVCTVLAVLLLVWLVTIVTLAQWQMSPTFDEQNHVTRGISVWRTGDYRLVLDHPPLANLLEALPVAWRPEVGFTTAMPDWDPAHLNIWNAARTTIWQHPSAGVQMIQLARLPVLLFALTLALVVFLWAEELFGAWGGVLALGLLALDPSILAHSGLATTDLAVTAMLVLAVYLLRRYLLAPSPGRLAWAGVGLGLALVSKFSALILLPIIGLLLLILAAQYPPATSRFLPQWATFTSAQRMKDAIKHCLLLGVIAGVVIWGVYGFHVEPLGSKIGQPLKAHASLKARLPVPAMQYLRGIKNVKHNSEKHPSYLLGHSHADGKGWWYYFPVVIAVKTPLPELLAMLGMLLLLASPRVRHTLGLPAEELWVLLLPAGVFLLAALGVLGISLNLGIRHILPLYPFLIILAGGWAVLPWRPRVLRPLLAVAVGWQLVSVLCVYPHFLAYFNEPAGGADRGSRILIDSNLDWGQDIGVLAQQQREHHLYPLAFSYFGTTPPEAYGLDCTSLAGSGVMHHAPAPDWQKMRGYLAVSVTNLYGGPGYAGADYRPLLALPRYACAGKTIFIYRIPEAGFPLR